MTITVDWNIKPQTKQIQKPHYNMAPIFFKKEFYKEFIGK